MMKLRGLIVAMVVLLGLMGVLLWSNKHPKSAESAEAAAATPPKILSLKEDDISKIDLKKKDAPEIVLAKNNGKWQIDAPKPLAADQTTVSTMLTTLSSFNSERLVEDKATDLNQYGLAQPAFETDVTLKDNKTQKLLLGDNSPTGNAVYAKLANDPRVFIVNTYEKNSLDKSLNDLRDKRLLTVNQDKISKVELTAKKQDIEFGRNKDEWQIVKPKPMRADGTQVEDLIRNLTDAKMDLSGTDDAKKMAAAFASATPVATAKVTDESGTQELQVRKNKDDYYAKSSIVDGVYKVSSGVAQGMDKSVDDFRNKKLFDFGFTDPNKLEIHDGAESYFLTRSGEDWWNGSGQKLEIGAAQSLIDKLREFSAAKFVDSGFTQPVIDLSVTSNDGKRVEQVSISKSGDNYIAKRENEPSLYQIDSKSVSDLQKAEEDLKPATPPSIPAKK
jgi:hypothetical protein